MKFNKETVMHLMDCKPDNPLYEELLGEMEGLEEKAYSLSEPKAVIAYGEIPALTATEGIPAGSKALFCIQTIGSGMSRWSSELFAEGDYLCGMLVNSMADDILFQVDAALKPYIIEMGSAWNMRICKRLEPPQDIGPELHQTAWEVTAAKAAIGVDIMSSYMFHPVKTNCRIYLLEEDGAKFFHRQGI